MTVATPRSAGISARHPLAPLTVAETGTAAELALAATGDSARLVYVTLAEPEKADVLGWDGTPLPRAALAVTWERPKRLIWMITVSLDENAVTAKVPVPGARPPIMLEGRRAASRRRLLLPAPRRRRPPGYEPGDRPGPAVREPLPPVAFGPPVEFWACT